MRKLVEVTLKDGRIIDVFDNEIAGLEKAKLLKDSRKEIYNKAAEKEKTEKEKADAEAKKKDKREKEKERRERERREKAEKAAAERIAEKRQKVDVELTDGKIISVFKYEADLLKKAGKLKDEVSDNPEKKEDKSVSQTKQEKDTGETKEKASSPITTNNIKGGRPKKVR